MGGAAVALGYNTTAIGTYSLAEGISTNAAAWATHAEGSETTAAGTAAHAEGGGCEAYGRNAHAEGSGTRAYAASSHAEGSTTKAGSVIESGEGESTTGGNCSHAEGAYSEAVTFASHAEGSETKTGGTAAHAEGTQTLAGGRSAHAEGTETKAYTSHCHAEGYRTIAGLIGDTDEESDESPSGGKCSHAEGSYAEATGWASHAEGSYTKAIGLASHAEGEKTEAFGRASHAAGWATKAHNDYQTAIGKFNKASDAANNLKLQDDAFIVGNGSASTPANALRITFEGQIYSAKTAITDGADYAEMFEWQDGNPAGEDRRGYFVTLAGEHIRKAASADGYILGVVSAVPTVIGDASGCGWHDMYLRDEWGDIVYEWADEERDVPETDPETGEERMRAETIRVQRAKVNPGYDPSKPYLPRNGRKEWSAVGMMGKLAVRDDGTCQPDGFCRPNGEGIATAAETGYRVMKRLDENRVRILMK
jgi:hypothetical protein